MLLCRTWHNKIWNSQVHLLFSQLTRGTREIGTQITVKLFLSTFLSLTLFYHLRLAERVGICITWMSLSWGEMRHFFFGCIYDSNSTFLCLPLALVSTKILGLYKANTLIGPHCIMKALSGCGVLVHKGFIPCLLLELFSIWQFIFLLSTYYVPALILVLRMQQEIRQFKCNGTYIPNVVVGGRQYTNL